MSKIQDKIDRLTEEALILSASGEHDGAIELMLDALDLNQNDPDTHNELANIYLRKYDFKNAISSYNKAIRLEPNFTYYYSNRAKVYAMQSNFKKAISDYKKAIEVDDNNLDAYYNSGVIYTSLNRLDKAIKLFKHIAEVDNSYANAFIGIAKIEGMYGVDILDKDAKKANKHISRAISNYTKALKIEPDNEVAVQNRAMLETLLNVSKVLDSNNDSFNKEQSDKMAKEIMDKLQGKI